MDSVKITFQCSTAAAKTLLPFLLKSRDVGDSNRSRWHCAFINGPAGFQIGYVDLECDDPHVQKILTHLCKSEDVIWHASAEFEYELDGTFFQHSETEITLFDGS